MLLFRKTELVKPELKTDSLGEVDCKISITDLAAFLCPFYIIFPSINISPIYLLLLSLNDPFFAKWPSESIANSALAINEDVFCYNSYTTRSESVCS
jgi:hypothetical protein